MINIGIDLDDTILDTLLETHKNERIFSKKYGVTIDQIWNDSNIKDKYLSEFLEKTYMNATLKNGVKNCLDDLSKKFNIIIITARNNKYVKNVESKTIKQLISLNVPYNKIIFDAGNKIVACKENRIELMIDNRPEKVDILNQNKINSILYNEKGNGMKCITDWNKVDVNFINSLINTY